MVEIARDSSAYPQEWPEGIVTLSNRGLTIPTASLQILFDFETLSIQAFRILGFSETLYRRIFRFLETWYIGYEFYAPVFNG